MQTPVATIRPITRGEVASIDDLVDFAGGRSVADTQRRRRRKVVRRSILAVVVLVAVYYAITLVQVYRTGQSDQARAVDAVVVMGAAQYDGRPSPQLAARLDHVVTLYGEGVAPLVIVTGGKQAGDRFTEAESSAQYLVDRGVPADAIVMESAGRTTYQSLAGAAELLAERGLDTVLVVTDPYHALRSRLTAEEVGLTAYAAPTPSSVIRGGNAIRRHLAEAGAVALGQIIGFDRI